MNLKVTTNRRKSYLHRRRTGPAKNEISNQMARERIIL